MTTQDPAAAISILREEPSWLVLAKPAGMHTVEQNGNEGAPGVE